jgi:hypothetical protein
MVAPAAGTLDSRSVDVTGLPEEAIRAVESFIAILRSQLNGSGPQFASYEEWSRAFHEWIASHEPRGTSADWSREGVYAGRGE